MSNTKSNVTIKDLEIKRYTAFREERAAHSGKAFVIIRPDNLPQLEKPVRAMGFYTCAVSKKKIESGDWCYNCNENPVRLNPYGKSKILVSEVNDKILERILPLGSIMTRIPTLEAIVTKKELQKVQDDLQKSLSYQGTKLLAAAKISRK